jgi:hypothetical protein
MRENMGTAFPSRLESFERRRIYDETIRIGDGRWQSAGVERFGSIKLRSAACRAGGRFGKQQRLGPSWSFGRAGGKQFFRLGRGSGREQFGEPCKRYNHECCAVAARGRQEK